MNTMIACSLWYAGVCIKCLVPLLMPLMGLFVFNSFFEVAYPLSVVWARNIEMRDFRNLVWSKFDYCLGLWCWLTLTSVWWMTSGFLNGVFSYWYHCVGMHQLTRGQRTWGSSMCKPECLELFDCPACWLGSVTLCLFVSVVWLVFYQQCRVNGGKVAAYLPVSYE